jgi:hypothetical protein
MAGKAQRALAKRPSFYEVVFAGSPKVVRGFLAGLLIGTGKRATVLYSFDSGIHHEGLRERIADFVRYHAFDCHVVVERPIATFLKRHAARIEVEAGIKITSCRHVRSAELPFEFTVYARHYDREILKLLEDLPAGLRLRDFEHHVEEDPDAKGAEAYSPVHDYIGRGSGKICGRIDRLVEYRERLVRQPLIKEGEIELQLA